ncbi:unnamed protein product [Cuscuta epithymum]|uniref:GDSL esterase/lipase n=1 Tax=Cuscuta epithymum TaxID=186058 RepID=A0AAV0GBI0_9ASTE|nr:unnamed protein product [Cuscuta epithymum]
MASIAPAAVLQVLALFLIGFLNANANAIDFNYPAVFNFGDSNSDTGELVAGVGDRLDPPNGHVYFKKPSGRFCDGRLIIDFLSRKYEKYIPAEDFFQKGLYTFDIGQNDLAGAFYSKTLDQVIASVPVILLEFENRVGELYDQGGARNFWIHNTGPLGCLPQNIAKFGTDPLKLDEMGCVDSHNLAARLFNLQLHSLCKKLQGKYTDATITYVDIFTIKSDLIATYSKYGFQQATMACCGVGGPPLNYDSRVSCGQTKVINGTTITAKGCDDSIEYINWDGIHYTDAANQYVAMQILTGKYLDPPPTEMSQVQAI